MNNDFEPPPLGRSILASIGGVVVAVGAVVGLETISSQLHQTNLLATRQAKIPSNSPNSPTPKTQGSTPAKVAMTPNPKALSIAKLDSATMEESGTPVTDRELIATAKDLQPQAGSLSPTENIVAKQAWKYFQENWQTETGLVNSVNKFTAVTLWDQTAGIAAVVSAKELNLISSAEFTAKMTQMLDTLSKLELYRGELPNKVYNSQTLLPVGYGKLDKREEIGWSAIDIGRMAMWLKIVGAKYPQFQAQTKAVWDRWKVDRLVQNGQMFGTTVHKGKEELNQEGRLGYESYAAYGLKLWGLDVSKALDVKSQVAFVNLYGKGIPYDRRDLKASGANNYVLSEPYILDGIETGFRSLPKAYADRVLAAQEARYQATKELTAVTEDNLDRPPYFVYSSLFVNGQPWGTITSEGETHNDLRFLSAKAAIGWYVLDRTPYTQKLFDFVRSNLKSPNGWHNGYYEALNEPNKAQTANNNGVILQSLLYKQVGQPLIVWAGVK
jgi:Protein of unknown function (DUF3131)